MEGKKKNSVVVQDVKSKQYAEEIGQTEKALNNLQELISERSPKRRRKKPKNPA